MSSRLASCELQAESREEGRLTWASVRLSIGEEMDVAPGGWGAVWRCVSVAFFFKVGAFYFSSTGTTTTTARGASRSRGARRSASQSGGANGRPLGLRGARRANNVAPAVRPLGRPPACLLSCAALLCCWPAGRCSVAARRWADIHHSRAAASCLIFGQLHRAARSASRTR